MERSEEFAPAVRELLTAVRGRPTPEGGRLSVDARSLPDAVSAARADGRTPVIAEVKPTSPTTDGVRGGDPVELATRMVEGGAVAVSVLTEPDHFGGSPDALRRVREAVEVPVVRKDFLLSEPELDRVRADVALLIARFVDDLPGMLAAARERGFGTLVEVHTREELAAAVAAGADVVGINNRDLGRLEVDLATFERVAPHAPEDLTLVAESGIGTPADVRRMREAGADALLVGSAIMGDAEPADPDGVRERTGELVEA